MISANAASTDVLVDQGTLLASQFDFSIRSLELNGRFDARGRGYAGGRSPLAADPTRRGDGAGEGPGGAPYGVSTVCLGQDGGVEISGSGGGYGGDGAMSLSKASTDTSECPNERVNDHQRHTEGGRGGYGGFRGGEGRILIMR